MKQYKVYTKEKGLVETDDYISDNIHKLTFHREDGPAFIRYHSNGKVADEVYYVHDKCHRLDGPADIVYDENGNIVYGAYWINDIGYTKEQYEKELLKLKFKSL